MLVTDIFIDFFVLFAASGSTVTIIYKDQFDSMYDASKHARKKTRVWSLFLTQGIDYKKSLPSMKTQNKDIYCFITDGTSG